MISRVRDVVVTAIVCLLVRVCVCVCVCVKTSVVSTFATVSTVTMEVRVSLPVPTLASVSVHLVPRDHAASLVSSCIHKQMNKRFYGKKRSAKMLCWKYLSLPTRLSGVWNKMRQK